MSAIENFGLGLFSSIANGFIQEGFNDLSSQRQYQYWKNMTDYVNAYNHPREQVKRLKEAGLHPALALGSANSAGLSAQLGAPSGGLPNTSKLLEGLSLANETKVADAQANYYNAEANEIKRNTKEGEESWPERKETIKHDEEIKDNIAYKGTKERQWMDELDEFMRTEYEDEYENPLILDIEAKKEGMDYTYQETKLKEELTKLYNKDNKTREESNKLANLYVAAQVYNIYQSINAKWAELDLKESELLTKVWLGNREVTLKEAKFELDKFMTKWSTFVDSHNMSMDFLELDVELFKVTATAINDCMGNLVKAVKMF